MEKPKAKPRKKWSADQIILEIRSARNLSPKYQQNTNPALYGASVRHFGSWKAALAGAGLSYSPQSKRRFPGSWNKEGCIEAIQSLDLKYSAHVRKNHLDIYSAALRLFGSWKVAVEAAGYEYSTITRGWRASRRL